MKDKFVNPPSRWDEEQEFNSSQEWRETYHEDSANRAARVEHAETVFKAKVRHAKTLIENGVTDAKAIGAIVGFDEFLVQRILDTTEVYA